MTFVLSMSHLFLSTGAAQLSTRSVSDTAVLEWISGLTMIAGLATLGFGLARY